MNPSQLPQGLTTKIGKITTPFGGQTQQEGWHPGIDIANSKGTPIPAFAGGRVLQTINNRAPGENNFGNTVVVQDKNGLKHRYSHLAKVAVKPGQEVADGQQIGAMGDSGATYSPSGGDSSNLDYRIVDAFGRFKDPTPYVTK